MVEAAPLLLPAIFLNDDECDDGDGDGEAQQPGHDERRRKGDDEDDDDGLGRRTVPLCCKGRSAYGPSYMAVGTRARARTLLAGGCFGEPLLLSACPAEQTAY